MGLFNQILGASTLIGATAGIFGGTIQIFRNGHELFNLRSELENIDTKENSYPNKIGKCRICSNVGYTEWHHIISQGHAKKTNQLDLLNNPGNIVELCKSCHNQTTASKSRFRLMNFRKRNEVNR